MTTEYILNREVDRVLSALTPVNALIIRAQLETGLRIGDVLKLEYWQLKNCFSVVETKTGKSRKVGMTTQLIEDIRSAAWRRGPRQAILDAREGKCTYWAFPSPVDWRKHRTRQGVWKDVKRAAKAFRLKANVGTHSMRKVYAVELLKKYGDIERVRRALNHEDVNVTLIYAIADQLVRDGHLRRVYKGSRRRKTGTS